MEKEVDEKRMEQFGESLEAYVLLGYIQGNPLALVRNYFLYQLVKVLHEQRKQETFNNFNIENAEDPINIKIG